MLNSIGCIHHLFTINSKIKHFQEAFLWPSLCHPDCHFSLCISLLTFTVSADCCPSRLVVSESLKCHWLLCVTLSNVTSECSKAKRLAIPNLVKTNPFKPWPLLRCCPKGISYPLPLTLQRHTPNSSVFVTG